MSKGRVMTSEHDMNFFAAIEEQASSLADRLNTTIEHLVQATQDEGTLSTYISTLLQQHAFTLQPMGKGQHFICGTYATKETPTLLLFSHCPPQHDALVRWGSFVTRLLTLAFHQETIGNLPVSIVWLIDIREYSQNFEELSAWLTENQQAVSIGGCIYDIPTDTSLPSPCIGLGMKGLLRFEIGIETASPNTRVLHGAILPNAAWRLTWALSSLKDVREEIHIEGFYETLVPIEDEEIELLRNMLPGEQALKQHLRVDEFLLQLHGFQLYYTYLLLPTCTVTSIHSGSTSSQTLPSSAKAEIDMHLVPDQEPEDIYQKLRKYLDMQGFQDVYIKILTSSPPQHTPLRNWFAKTVCESAYTLYGEALPIFPLMPTQHICTIFQAHLAIPVVYTHMGYGHNQLYERDTVTRKERQKQILIHEMNHLAMIIENMATDTHKEPL